MKQIFTVLLISTVLFTEGKAQEETINKGFGYGMHLSQYQRDFGIGAQLTSPYFLKDRLAVRLRGNFMFNEHLDVENDETTWTGYGNLTLGIVSVGGYVGEHIRLYGEAGAIVIFPNDEFSTKSTEFGFYGSFGFEFFSAPGSNYFIEIGGMGTGAHADAIPGKPIYSNGLMLSVGWRGTFK